MYERLAWLAACAGPIRQMESMWPRQYCAIGTVRDRHVGLVASLHQRKEEWDVETGGAHVHPRHTARAHKAGEDVVQLRERLRTGLEVELERLGRDHRAVPRGVVGRIEGTIEL